MILILSVATLVTIESEFISSQSEMTETTTKHADMHTFYIDIATQIIKQGYRKMSSAIITYNHIFET